MISRFTVEKNVTCGLSLLKMLYVSVKFSTSMLSVDVELIVCDIDNSSLNVISGTSGTLVTNSSFVHVCVIDGETCKKMLRYYLIF
jgi:hypothetical protein